MAAFDEPLEPQLEGSGSQVGRVGPRLARVEGIVEQMDQRLANIEATLRDMNARMVTKGELWLWVIVLTLWVAIGTAVATFTRGR
jgi:hypothetical protein